MAENNEPPVTATSLAPAPIRRRYWLVVGSLFLLSLWVFGAIALEYPSGRYRAFDETILRFFRNDADTGTLRGPLWIRSAMESISALGHGLVLTTVVVGAAGYLVFHRRWRAALTIAGVAAGGTILDVVLKSMADRPRPTVVPHLTEVITSSFPSGHALLSAVIYLSVGMIIAQSSRSLRSAFFAIGSAVLLTLLIGISRVFLGVHHPTDVLAGWAAGVAWILVCVGLEESCRRRHP